MLVRPLGPGRLCAAAYYDAGWANTQYGECAEVGPERGDADNGVVYSQLGQLVILTQLDVCDGGHLG